jgi:hypothetical protein
MSYRDVHCVSHRSGLPIVPNWMPALAFVHWRHLYVYCVHCSVTCSIQQPTLYIVHSAHYERMFFFFQVNCPLLPLPWSKLCSRNAWRLDRVAFVLFCRHARHGILRRKELLKSEFFAHPAHITWKSSGSGLENREYGRRDPSRWPHGTLYPQKLALTPLRSGGRWVGIIRSRTQVTEFPCQEGVEGVEE